MWDCFSFHSYARTCTVGFSCQTCQVFTFLCIEQHSQFSCPVSNVIEILLQPWIVRSVCDDWDSMKEYAMNKKRDPHHTMA